MEVAVMPVKKFMIAYVVSRASIRCDLCAKSVRGQPALSLCLKKNELVEVRGQSRASANLQMRWGVGVDALSSSSLWRFVASSVSSSTVWPVIVMILPLYVASPYYLLIIHL